MHNNYKVNYSHVCMYVEYPFLLRYVVVHSLYFLIQHDLAAITKWYKKLSENNPRIVRLVDSIGKTEEGRDIPAVHITAAAQNSEVPKFYFQCLIHASKLCIRVTPA